MSGLALTDEKLSEIELIAQQQFTESDYEILESYKSVVDGLALFVGDHCEILLHSLEDINHSTIKIANGQHTGRKLGSPITDLGLKILHEMRDANRSISTPYFTRAKSGDLMKSIIIAIRNKQNRVIGFLCINMNLDIPFSQIIQTFIPPQMEEPAPEVNFASSIDDLVSQSIEFSIAEVNADRNVSNNIKNRQIVLNLYEKGIFDIKDAVNQVADRLDISKHTVYLYIRQFKNGDFCGCEQHG